MDQDPCPECGALAVGGRAGCQALYEAVAASDLGPAGLGPLRDLANIGQFKGARALKIMRSIRPTDRV